MLDNVHCPCMYMYVTVEVNDLVIMNNNWRRYKMPPLEINIPVITHICQLITITIKDTYI
jgi:hypothetical protein